MCLNQNSIDLVVGLIHEAAGGVFLVVIRGYDSHYNAHYHLENLNRGNKHLGFFATPLAQRPYFFQNCCWRLRTTSDGEVCIHDAVHAEVHCGEPKAWANDINTRVPTVEEHGNMMKPVQKAR